MNAELIFGSFSTYLNMRAAVLLGVGIRNTPMQSILRKMYFMMLVSGYPIQRILSLCGKLNSAQP